MHQQWIGCLEISNSLELLVFLIIAHHIISKENKSIISLFITHSGLIIIRSFFIVLIIIFSTCFYLLFCQYIRVMVGRVILGPELLVRATILHISFKHQKTLSFLVRCLDSFLLITFIGSMACFLLSILPDLFFQMARILHASATVLGNGSFLCIRSFSICSSSFPFLLDLYTNNIHDVLGLVHQVPFLVAVWSGLPHIFL